MNNRLTNMMSFLKTPQIFSIAKFIVISAPAYGYSLYNTFKLKLKEDELAETQSKLLECQSLLEKANLEIQSLKTQAQLNLVSDSAAGLISQKLSVLEYCLCGVGVTAGVAILIIVGKFAAPALTLSYNALVGPCKVSVMFQNFTPYFLCKQTFQLYDEVNGVEWLVNLFNGHEIEILLKFDGCEFLTIWEFMERLQQVPP
jgi:hypothetical protein